MMALEAIVDEMWWKSMLLAEVIGQPGREKLTGMPMKDFFSSTEPIFAVYQRINLTICRRRSEGRCVLRE